jgi:hypothetical protein
MVKRPLHVEFGPQQLTSYSGLELLRRYLRQRELPSRLRAACAATGGDYGGGRLALLVLALLYVGARRLEHLRYLAGDPLIARFCGLARIPMRVAVDRAVYFQENQAARQTTHVLDGAGLRGWPCGQVVLTDPPPAGG